MKINADFLDTFSIPISPLLLVVRLSIFLPVTIRLRQFEAEQQK